MIMITYHSSSSSYKFERIVSHHTSSNHNDNNSNYVINNNNNNSDNSNAFPAHDELGTCRSSCLSPEQSVLSILAGSEPSHITSFWCSFIHAFLA